MKLALLALTGAGKKTAYKLKDGLKRLGYKEIDLYLPAKMETRKVVCTFSCSLKELVGDIFNKYDGIIFIMALGIVVRVLAPYLKDKSSDPAVITLDETGRNVISTLSGHLGGANHLTERIAALTGANPVITTATDCQGKLAFDLLAKRLNCEIIPFDNLKYANSALVNNKPVNIFTGQKLKITLPENVRVFSLQELSEEHLDGSNGQNLVESATKISKFIAEKEGFPVIISNKCFQLAGPYLQLVPRNIIIGIGSRRGVSTAQVEEAVNFALNKLNLRRESIRKLVTIDLKRDESGITEYAGRLGVPLEIVKRDEIKQLNLNFTESEFVKKKIGVGGVCEPAAMLVAQKGELILSKTVLKGVTVAVVEENSI